MSTAVPDWMREHLIRSGRWNAEGVSRAVRGRACRQCGRRVLVGLIDQWGAVTVDAHPIDGLGEVMALAQKRWTFALWPDGIDKWHLVLRAHWDVAGSPAGKGCNPVFSRHNCTDPLPPDNREFGVRATAYDTPDHPPF